MSRSTIQLMSAIALITSSSVFAADSIDPNHVAGGHYTATLHQHAGNWEYTPADGQDLRLSGADNCSQATSVPKGVWLLTRSADGAPELQAPSAVALPNGHSGHVQLVSCDTPADGVSTIAAPQALLDILAASSGAVRIDD